MHSRSLLYTANAGFLLTVNDITIAVDAFPQEAERGFSALSQEDFDALCQGSVAQSVRYVLVTHDHKDHYSPDRTRQFLTDHPQADFFGLFEKDQLTYYLRGVTLEFQKLPHDGAQFAQVANYGCLLTFSDSTRVLFLGDAQIGDPAIARWIDGRSIDLALVNFPWITLPKGRQFLADHLPGARLAILHLPYEAEDRNHYCEATQKAAALVTSHEVTLLTSFGQQMTF